MATNNAINTTSGKITLEKAASDLQTTYIGGNTWSIGLDDDDGDSFKISKAAALGTSDTFKMTTAGELTMPLQPVFLATGTTENNVTGDGTVAYLGATAAFTAITNQGSCFNVGGGGVAATFTAPVTGTYLFSFVIQFYSPAGGGDRVFLMVRTSNRDYYVTNIPTRNRVANFMGVDDQLSFSNAVIADMDAADTTRFIFVSYFGAKTDDIINAVVGGFLIC